MRRSDSRSNRRHCPHISTGLVLLACISACAHRSTRPAPPANLGDAELFEVVVRASIEQIGMEGLRIDPRPLPAAALLKLPSEAGVEPLSIERLDQRLAVLRRLGIDSIDARRIGQDSTCVGILVVSDPQAPVGAYRANHRGCPSSQLTVVAIGSPRPGTMKLPSGVIYDHSTMNAAVGYQAVRIVKTEIGPGGSAVSYWDYILRRQNNAWQFVRAIGLLYVG